MSLEHAILGFLNYGPMTGYDLKKTFDVSIRHFWPADRSQIYRTLSQLAEAGLAEVEVVPQEGKPNRKVYHITDAGRTELIGWLTAGPPPAEVRNAGLIQVFFAGELADAEIIRMLQRQAEEIRAVLHGYKNYEPDEEVAGYMRSRRYGRKAFFWMLTLEHGITMYEEALRWIEGVIKRLKQGKHLGRRRKES